MDVVFLTHLHVDHVGWNTDRDGVVVFPNARYVAHRDGIAFAGNSGRPHIERTIVSVEFEEIDGEAVVAEGVTAFPLPGHFPGHMGLRIDSEGERAVLIADAAVNPMLLDQPDRAYVSDGDAAVVRRNAPCAAAGARRPGRPHRLRPLSGRRHRPCRHSRRPRRVGGGRWRLVF